MWVRKSEAVIKDEALHSAVQAPCSMDEPIDGLLVNTNPSCLRSPVKPANPIVMYMVRGVYFPLFFFPLMAGSVAISSLLAFVPISKEWLEIFVVVFQVVSILLLLYSLWLAREASIAFSEDNCFFLEAYWVALKRSLMYLQFLPIVGHFFMGGKTQEKGEGESVKTVNNQTRFD